MLRLHLHTPNDGTLHSVLKWARISIWAHHCFGLQGINLNRSSNEGWNPCEGNGEMSSDRIILNPVDIGKSDLETHLHRHIRANWKRLFPPSTRSSRSYQLCNLKLSTKYQPGTVSAEKPHLATLRELFNKRLNHKFLRLEWCWIPSYPSCFLAKITLTIWLIKKNIIVKQKQWEINMCLLKQKKKHYCPKKMEQENLWEPLM